MLHFGNISSATALVIDVVPWTLRHQNCIKIKKSLYWKETSLSTDLILNHNQKHIQIYFLLLSHFFSISHIKSTIQRNELPWIVSTVNNKLQHLKRPKLYQNLSIKYIAWLLDLLILTQKRCRCRGEWQCFTPGLCQVAATCMPPGRTQEQAQTWTETFHGWSFMSTPRHCTLYYLKKKKKVIQ